MERVKVYRGDAFDSKISISKFCEEYWDWSKSKYIQRKILLSPGSISKPYADYNRAYIRNYILKYFKTKLLSELKIQDLDDLLLYLAGLRKKISPNTINKIMAAVLAPLKEAYRLNLISIDPSRGSYRLGSQSKAKGVFTAEEIGALSAVDWDNETAFLAFKLSAASGMRLGEIRALKIEDIGTDHIKLNHSFSKTEGLKSPKNGKTRIVPLPTGLITSLKRLALTNPYGNGFVFWTTEGKAPMGDKAITGALYRAMTHIGIDENARRKRNVSFHSLRHFFNTTMRGHVSEEALRATMGHSSVDMTNRYDHALRIDEDSIRNAQNSQILSLFKKGA
jgi:integrase